MKLQKIKQAYKQLSLPMKASLWFAICTFIQRGFSMITTPIFTRILPKAEYGVANTFTAWQNVLILLATLSLYKSQLNLYKDIENKNKILSAVSWLSFIISGSVFLFAVLFLKQLSTLLGMSKILTLSLFILFVPMSIINCWSTQERYEFKYKENLIVSLILFGSTFLSAFCVIFISNSAEAKIVPMVATYCVVGAFLFISIIKKDDTIYDKQIWSFSLSFCIALLPHYLSEFVLQSSDKLMINAMCSSEDVAVYSVGYSVASLINMVTSSINSTFLPYRYQMLNEKEYIKLSKNTSKIIALVAAALAVLMFLGPEIVWVFGGSGYKDASTLIIPICLGIFFNFIFQIFAGVQEYFEKKKNIVIASISCALLNILLNYIFIRIYGYQAAAYTTFACYAIFCGLHYCFYRKVCKNELKGVFIYDMKAILLVSICTVLGGVAISVVNKYIIVKYCILLVFAFACIKGKRSLINFVKGALNK